MVSRPPLVTDAPAVTIRAARPGDEAAIAGVIRRAYAEYRAELSPELHTAYVEHLLELAQHDDGGDVLVAEHGTRIVGTVRCYTDATAAGFGWPSSWSVLRSLAVEPDERGRGIGRQLIAACVDRARAAKAPALGLHTAGFMPAAVRAYERMGFVRSTEHDVGVADVLHTDAADTPRIIAYRLPLAAPTDHYPLPRTSAEVRRLVLQGQVYGPITRQFLTAAGITRGMRVLDLGSGAGDVVLTLADLVGPDGEVVGVDLDGGVLATARRRVDAAGWANVELHQRDVGDAGNRGDLSAGGPFDAVVGRWILMYQDDPTALLRRASSLLRPGGLVAFLESADLNAGVRAHPSTPTHERIARWMAVPSGVPGPTLDMGLRLRRTFVDAGLPDPQLRLDAPIGGGERWPGYELCAETVRSVLPLLEQFGTVTATEADVETLADRLRDEVVACDGVQVLPAVVGAWSRRA